MSASITTESVEQVVVDSIASFGPDRADVVRSATFEALDIDSLDLAELSQIVEEHFGIELKSNDVANIKTVGDVVDLILARA